MTGRDALAVRASRKLKSGELLVTSFAGTILRLQLDRIPLWCGDHVAGQQIVEDFARYPYLPRFSDASVLLKAAGEGVGLLTWEQDAFAFPANWMKKVGSRPPALNQVPPGSATASQFPARNRNKAAGHPYNLLHSSRLAFMAR